MFFCNSAELFVLMWSLHSLTVYRGDQQAKARLHLGEKEIKYGPMTEISHATYDLDSYGSSMMMAVAYCEEGAGFRLEAQRWSDNENITTYSAGNSSFTGFRISHFIGEEVAFMAETREDISIFPGHPINFKNRLLDTGDNFHPIFGYFRCPDNAVYAFSWSLQAKGMFKGEASLYKEYVQVFKGPGTNKLHQSSYPTPNSGTARSHAIIQCSQGDDIYIMNEEPDVNKEDYTELEKTLTSFSGYKIGIESNVIAFSAILEEDQLVVVDTIIKYNNATLNTGGHYRPTIGSFMCPNNNFFVFMWTLQLSSHFSVYIHLVKDGVEVKAGPATTYCGHGTGGTASMSAVVQCTVDAAISVQVEHNKYHAMNPYFAGGYNYFSGFELK